MIDGALKKVCEYTVAEKAQYDILVNGVKTAKSSLTEHLNDCHAKVASEDFNEFLAMARIQVKEAIIANGVDQTQAISGPILALGNASGYPNARHTGMKTAAFNRRSWAAPRKARVGSSTSMLSSMKTPSELVV